MRKELELNFPELNPIQTDLLLATIELQEAKAYQTGFLEAKAIYEDVYQTATAWVHSPRKN